MLGKTEIASRYGSLEGYDLHAALHHLEKVSPVLHHLGAWFEMDRVVVCGTDSVPRSMRQLKLNMLMRVSVLMICVSVNAIVPMLPLAIYPHSQHNIPTNVPAGKHGFSGIALEVKSQKPQCFLWLEWVSWILLEVLERGDGGETGIRTLDTLRYTRFPSVRLQPLGHLSALFAGLFESNTIYGFL